MTDIADRIRSSLTGRKDIQQGLAAAAHIAKRKLDGLELFRPADYQEAAVLSEASELLICGGTRSGKTTIAIAMMASYLRNKPIIFADGTQHHMREPGLRNKSTICWTVGEHLNHIGQTIFRMLRKPGCFEMVRDKQTGMWRAWQPGRIPGDENIPETDRYPAPPMLPDSEVLQETWESRAENKFTSLTVADGSVLYAFASSGEVKRGDPVSRIFVDERVLNSQHYAEWQSRLSDRKGRIWWSSYPDLNTPALIALYRRAVEQEEEFKAGTRAKIDVQQLRFSGETTPFIERDEIRKRTEGWTPEERRARGLGEFTTDTILAYPDFDRRMHVVDYGHTSPRNDRITDIMRRLNWNVPPNWAVDLILDPGTQRPALIWGAIPPPELWDEGEPYYIVFRELTVPRIDAREIAARVKAVDPTRTYCRFIIDDRAGRQLPPGFSWKIREQYAREFQAAGLTSSFAGVMFLKGEDSWFVRSVKLRNWMRGRLCGRPQLRIVTHACPTLVRQIESVTRNVSKEDIQDKLAPGQIHDAVDVLEYWAGNDPTFIIPPPQHDVDSPGLRMFNQDNQFWSNLTKAKPQTQSKQIILGVP